MSAIPSFDTSWESEVYAQGRQLNRWPFDLVVSFLFRHAPRERGRGEVRVLEVGCGAGNNLWFAAREGFRVAGVDASQIAIRAARERLAAEGLAADLRVADFSELPFEDASFDLAIDRQAITCSARAVAGRAVAELSRVLAPGGKLLCNVYSDRHSSRLSGERGPDGLVLRPAAGTLAGMGQIRFYSGSDLDELLREGWKELSREHEELRSLVAGDAGVHAEWRVVAQKL